MMDRDTLIALQTMFSENFREQVEASPWKRSELVGTATTRADIDLEQAMSASARQILGPNLTIIGEEAVSSGKWADIYADRVILIDPIDGTRLFRANDPGFASTFALLEGGRFVGGAISLPAVGRATLFTISDTPDEGGHCADDNPLELAARVSDTPQATFLAEHFAGQGFSIARLGSSARRLLDISEGRCDGLIKRIDASFGVPRLWGIATGLAYCASRGLHFWWDQRSQTMAVGGLRLKACWPTHSDLSPIEYSELWSKLTAIGSARAN